MTLRLRGESWSYDFVIKKQRYYGSIGKVSKQMAARIEAKLKKEALANHFQLLRPKMPTVAAAFEQYLTGYRLTHRPRSVYSIEWHLAQFSRRWGKWRLDRLTPDVLRSYAHERLKAGYNPNYINHELSILRAFFSSVETLVPNPLKRSNGHKGVQMLPRGPQRVRYLTEEEDQRLWVHLSPTIKPLVIVALQTGLRLSELLGLTWDDVDLDSSLVIVRAELAKSGRERRVPLNRIAYKTLQQLASQPRGVLLRKYKEVFRNSMGRPYKDPSHVWRRAVKRAGINNFRFHDLRHTFASRLVWAGYDIRIIQELLGHSSITMTQRYTHLGIDHLRGAVDDLTQPAQQQQSHKSESHTGENNGKVKAADAQAILQALIKMGVIGDSTSPI